VQVLIDSGVDVNSKGPQNGRALHLAAQQGHHGVVQLLLAASGVDVNCRGLIEDTPLHCAAQVGHKGIVKLLLEAPGIDVNSKGGLFDGTSLHYAAMKGHQGIVELLLAAGADFNTENFYGATALHLAAVTGHQGIAGQLLAAGARMNMHMVDGSSPLALAVKEDHAGVVQQLLDAVLQRFQDRKGTSAAQGACTYMLEAVQEGGIVFGPKVSKLPVVKAALKERKCSCCGRWLRKIKYYKCSRCKLVHYCGPECQAEHWRDGHKEVCKAT
jgi:ankyrin repeat protein